MTVKDFSENSQSSHMAKRKKTGPNDHETEQQNEHESSKVGMPSDEMIGVIIAATRTPDLNIVDFSDTISEVDIMPEPEPLSDSGLPLRPQKHKKKKKKHPKDSKTEQASTDRTKSTHTKSKDNKTANPSTDRIDSDEKSQPGTSSTDTSS